jgi:tetratricopeptide (TPR) repeat protein
VELKFSWLILSLACLPAVAQTGAPEQAGRDRRIVEIQEAITSGQTAQADALLRDALARYPNDGGILNLRGVLHAQQGDLGSARQDFTDAVRQAPALLPAWQNLGRACQALAAGAPAHEDAVAHDSGAVDCAIRSWRHVLVSEKDNREARFGLATLIEWKGEFSESLRELALLPPGEEKELPVAALRCANLAGLGRWNEALDIAKQLAQSSGYTETVAAGVFPVLKKPEAAPVVIALAEPLSLRQEASPQTLRLLSGAYEKAKRPEDARRTLERAAILDPGKTSDLYELTRLAYLSHDFEGALGYLGRLRDMTPKDARVHFLFGIVAVEMKLPVEARRSLEEALKLAPKNPIYSLALGSIILSSRDAGDAVPYFQTYLAAHPDDPRGHFALGMGYFAANDYDKARAEMTRAAKHRETSGGAEYFLGRIARAEDQLDQAAVHLQRTIEILPKFADARAELARVRLRQADTEKARAELAEALAIDPDNYQANTVLLALYERTRDAKVAEQRERIKQLQAKRKDEEQLMLRTIEMRPF